MINGQEKPYHDRCRKKIRSTPCLAGLGLALGIGVWVFQEEINVADKMVALEIYR